MRPVPESERARRDGEGELRRPWPSMPSGPGNDEHWMFRRRPSGANDLSRRL